MLLEDQALVLADLGQSADARAAIQGALEKLKKLSAAHPGDLLYRQEVIGEYMQEAAILKQNGDMSGADAVAKERQDFEQSSPIPETGEAARFAETLKKHRSQGEELLSKKQYNRALEELRIAERETLQSGHYLVNASGRF